MCNPSIVGNVCYTAVRVDSLNSSPLLVKIFALWLCCIVFYLCIRNTPEL